jgi:adenosylcobinamide-GDP ribazoletransferase
MKDSHIGTYGVLGLVVYMMLLGSGVYALASDGRGLVVLAILAADPFAKMVTAQLVMMMPYARSEEEAKAKVVYRKMDWRAGVGLAVQGLLPMGAFIWLADVDWQMLIFAPCLVMYFLYLLIWRRLHGYTGDCCGAVCLLVELTVYLTLTIDH